MKPLAARAAGLLLAAAACLTLVVPARASDDPFADFRIPDHTWRTGTAQFDLAGGHSASGPGRATGFQTIASASVSRSHDSDVLQHSLGFSLGGYVQSQTGRQELGLLPYWSSLSSFARAYSEHWSLSGSLRAYPWKDLLGLDLQGYVQGAAGRSRSREDLASWRSEPPPTTRSERRLSQTGQAYSYQATLQATLGLGRVRDATVVYEVHLLEQRLRESGALARALSPAAREKLAALYYVASDFSAAYERPDRFVWREIERVLREDGALGERGLDAYSVLRARERYVPAPGVTRMRGYYVGPVVSLRHYHNIARQEVRWDQREFLDDVLVASSSDGAGERRDYSFDQAQVGGRAQYFRPLGWRWQLDAEALALLPVRPGEHGQTVDSHLRAVWFVADRWAAEARVSQHRSWARLRGDVRAREDAWSVAYGASLTYYVEDHLALQAALNEQQTHTTYVDGDATYRAGSLSLGLSYRFLGALDAPGLIEPVRPLR